MKKITKMNELAWVIGILVSTFGVALCTKADFGLSMIAAPPYIFHVWLRDMIPWFTQGTSEYAWQGVILLLTCIVTRQFKFRYLISFGTAVLAGLSLDMWLMVFGGNGAYEELWVRIAAFFFGEIVTSFAIAFVFRTTLPIQIYELAVVVVAEKFSLDRNKVKLANDIIMLVLSAVLSFVLTGGFNGFGIGTIIITVVNAPLIGIFGKIVDRYFEFDSMFPKLFGERKEK
ncbi:MAG: hypothetical protein E7672_08440 [Ruminococcaceae bacterium]|nr:hypothetical protein [Oscillospiraceae bacterium]